MHGAWLLGRGWLASGSRRRVLAGVLMLLGVVPVVAPSRAWAVGELTPIGCIENPGGTYCLQSGGATPGLAGASGVAVSPDGKNAYATSQVGGAVVWLTRQADGSLTPLGCVTALVSDTDRSASGGTAPGLGQPQAVAVSPDGKNVYVVSSVPGEIAVFARAANGGLTFQQCIEETGGTDCNASGGTAAGLKGAVGVAVSADGQNVYVAAHGSNAIAVFLRGAGGGLSENECVDDKSASECTLSGGEVAGLKQPISIAVSQDGNGVYVASFGSNAVAEFSRDPSSGNLTRLGCIQNTGGTDCIGAGGTAPALAGAAGVAISPDSASVYVAALGSSAIAEFTRGTSGALTFAQCIEETGGTDCLATGRTTSGLQGPVAAAISPDNQNAYTLAYPGNALATFARQGGGGLQPVGCIASFVTQGCSHQPELYRPIALAVSADGQNLYVAANGSNAILEYARERGAPVVASGTATAVTPTTATLTARVNPNGGLGSYHFAYGTTTAYPTHVPTPDANVGADSLTHPVAQLVTGLAPRTTYHFRIVATNADGIVVGRDQTFTTPRATGGRRPVLSGLHLTPSRFRAARSGGSIARHRAKHGKAGTGVSYREATRALALITVERKLAGVRRGKRCVALRGRSTRHAKPCPLEVVLGSFTHHDQPGVNRFVFTGRIAGAALAPGSYTLLVVASNTAGASNSIHASFRIQR